MSEESASNTDARSPQLEPGPSVGELALRDTSAGTALSTVQVPAYPTYQAGEDPLAGGIDYTRVWHAFRRQWIPAIFLGGVLGCLLAPLAWFMLPKGYEAVAWLRVRGTGDMLSNTSGSGGEYESYRKTQAQLITSPFVLASAMRKPEMAGLATFVDVEDPVDWLADNLQVATPAESEVLQIRLRGPNPEEAAKIVNNVTTAYLDDIVDKERSERLSRRDVLERKYKENMAEIRSRRETFNNLARQLGTKDSSEVSTQRMLLLDHVSSLRSQMNSLEREISVIDAELAVMQAQANGDFETDDDNLRVPEPVVQQMIANDPQVASLQAQLLDLNQTISFQEQRSVRGSSEPAVKRLRRQRDELLEQMDLRRTDLRPQVIAQLSLGNGGSGKELLASPAELSMRRQMAADSLSAVKKEFDNAASEAAVLGQANADMEARSSEIEHLQSVTDDIGKQLESSAIDLAMPNRVTLLESAGVPGASDQIFRFMLTGLAAVAGLVVGGGSIVAMEYLRDRLDSSEAVPKRIGVRVLGTLPRISRGRRHEGLITECVDSLRTLVTQGGREAPRVILVTSAVEHEGKTTVASQLAASFARADKRTLLLDGDLRHPNVHLALDIDLGVGFAELLRGEISTDEAVQPTTIEGLFAVTAGQCDYAAISALSRPDLPKLLAGFRDSFDHIVIDAGPVLAFADSLLLGQNADVALVAALKDVSRVPKVSAAIDRLRSVGVRVQGTVVNGVADARPKRLYMSPLPT
jgi:capsular exopolysaccharide synthesis family protein